jgi:hypothetical protein
MRAVFRTSHPIDELFGGKSVASHADMLRFSFELLLYLFHLHYGFMTIVDSKSKSSRGDRWHGPSRWVSAASPTATLQPPNRRVERSRIVQLTTKINLDVFIIPLGLLLRSFLKFRPPVLFLTPRRANMGM